MNKNNIDNIYIKANKIKLRIKLINIEGEKSYLTDLEIAHIKKVYPMSQWVYQIAKLEEQQGYLDEYKTEYI